MLGLIRRNLWACNQRVKSTTYTSLVRPLLEYASSVWDTSNQTNIARLNRVQRQAAGFSMNNHTREDGVVTKILKELEWQPLEARRKIKKVTMLYKIQNMENAESIDKILIYLSKYMQ